MTHEPDTSRPLPGVTPDYSKKWTDFSFDYLKEDSGVTPEQRLIDLAEKVIAVEAEVHPTSYMNGGKDKHFCDQWECDWRVRHDYALLSIRFNPQTIKALAEVVRAAREFIALIDTNFYDAADLIATVAALDSQEEQQG